MSTGTGTGMGAGTGAPTSLEIASTWVEMISGIVTPLAVIVGGVWAYFTFYKERTYRPHIDMDIAGDWLPSPGALRLTLTIKNIGKSKFDMLSQGTGVKVKTPARVQPSPPAETTWEDSRVFPVFARHEWIEPGESVTDELLIALAPRPDVVEVEARIVFAARPRNIVIHSRRVLELDSGLSQRTERAGHQVSGHAPIPDRQGQGGDHA